MHSPHSDSANDYAREKTRYIVGRAALRRASRTIQDWQLEEQEKGQLAKRIAIGLLIVVLLGVALSIFI